jgi:tetratricopeptide (TPR) repeat protein
MVASRRPDDAAKVNQLKYILNPSKTQQEWSGKARERRDAIPRFSMPATFNSPIHNLSSYPSILAILVIVLLSSSHSVASRSKLAADLLSLEATLSDSRAARARFDFVESLRLLNQAAKFHQPSAELFNEYGNLYLDVEAIDQADAYFNKALKIQPANDVALAGRAGCDLLRRDYTGAENRLRAALVASPQSLALRTALARVLFDSNQTEAALADATRVLASDQENKEALYILAFVKATAGEAKEARQLVRRALAIDPCNPNLRRLLSQYVNGRAGYTQKVSRAANQQYEAGRTLKRNGDLAVAAQAFEEALAVEPGYYRALISLGNICLQRGQYERAIDLAQRAIAVDADGASAHLEMCYAYLGLRERGRIAIGAKDFAAEFFKQPVPPKFALTAEIFPNYKTLDSKQQLVIDVAVAPLAGFLQTLADKKARHYLLAFDERAGDIPGVEDVERERTSDGRYFASLRGVGGRVTVSGLEYLDMAAHAGYHTIAHEFAHQVQMIALDRSDLNALHRLYVAAVRDNRALDYYAASDELEYFAQGYEAYVSLVKRPATGMTARHTRDELKARDPELYRFIEGLGRRSPAN